MQSFIAGGLVGIITAYSVRSPLEARLWAFIGFWAQQIAAYVLIIGLTLLTWGLIETFMLPSAGRALLTAGSVFLLYVFVREALISGLWRWMLFLSLGAARPRPVELR